MTAAHDLDDALLRMAEHGETPPCFGLDGFTSDDPLERRIAAPICQTCPIQQQCQAAAEERDEKFGVWAGRDRTPRQGRPRFFSASHLTDPPVERLLSPMAETIRRIS